MASSSLLSPLPLRDDGDAIPTSSDDDSSFGLGPLQQAQPPVSPSPPLSPVPQSRPGKRATRVDIDTEEQPSISRDNRSTDEKLAEARILREAAANKISKSTEGSEEHRAATKEFKRRDKTFKRLERESKDAAKKTLPPRDADFDLALFIGPDPQVIALETQALAQQKQAASLEEQLGDSTRAEQESQVGIAQTSNAGAVIAANLADTQEQLKKAQAKISKLGAAIEEKKRTITVLGDVIDDHDHRIAKLTEELTAQITQLQQEKNALNEELDEKRAAHQMYTEAAETHRAALEAARSERERLAQILDERQRRVGVETEELSSLTERVSQILQQLDSSVEHGSALKQLLATRTEENAAEVDAKIKDLTGELNLSRENERKLNFKIEEFQQLNDATNAEIARLSKEIEANRDRMIATGQQQTGTFREKNDLEAQNKKLRKLLEDRRIKIEEQTKKIGALEASFKTTTVTTSAEKQVLDELNAGLRRELGQLQEQVRKREARHNARKGELARVSNLLGEKDKQIADISGELQTASLHVVNVERDMAELRAELELSKDQTVFLGEQNDSLSKQIELLQQGATSSKAFEQATEEFKQSASAEQVKLERERNKARLKARQLRDASIQLQRDAESNREELAVKEKQLAEEIIERNRFSEQLGAVSEDLRKTQLQLVELASKRAAFKQQRQQLMDVPGRIARTGPLAGFSYSSSSSDEEAYRRRARSQNSFRDALVDDDSPSSSEPVRVSRPESSALAQTTQWTRPPVRSGAARRREIIDINNFKPDIPAQAEAWKVKLEGVARDINIGDPDRVYRSVEQLLRSTHPSESEFYHRFYTMIGWVEGACAKNKGAFWIAKTEGLQHLTKDVIEAATTKINTIPISEAEFFPLSRDELTTGIARELTVYRRMTTSSGRKVEVAAPAYQLVKSVDDYRNTVIRRQQDELNDAAAGFVREEEAGDERIRDERASASRNQQRYLKRNPEAPLLGFGQRYVESKAVDRLDPNTLTLFNYESALIIPYNFWYFLQEKIISKLNVGHDKYVVELKNMTDHAWTNVPAGHTINDIAHYLADNLWDKLQIRHAKGSTERIPSVLSVKKMLDDLAIKRVTEQMSFIDANYNQAWQDRIVALLQTAVHPNAFNSFITALAKIGYPFDVYDPRLNRVLQNITFANLVGAIYQQNVLSNRAGGVTGRQIVAADSKVSRLIDELSRSLGISTTFAYTPPQTIYGGFARSSSSSSSDQSTASIPSFLSI